VSFNAAICLLSSTISSRRSSISCLVAARLSSSSILSDKALSHLPISMGPKGGGSVGPGGFPPGSMGGHKYFSIFASLSLIAWNSLALLLSRSVVISCSSPGSVAAGTPLNHGHARTQRAAAIFQRRQPASSLGTLPGDFIEAIPDFLLLTLNPVCSIRAGLELIRHGLELRFQAGEPCLDGGDLRVGGSLVR